MNILDIIEKVKRHERLTDCEIDWFVQSYTAGTIPDYQMSALLMAIRLNGLTDKETTALTYAMANSGDRIDLSGIEGVTVDKHSTGGVSDATTFIVVPILACLGCKVAKMSGRGLGFTGGTIDKLEAFEGYDTEQTEERFIKIVNSVGASIIGATKNIAPADKKLYALRDVTATVDSIPLIASSIMSKKLAAGAHVIVLDVKYGSGAFMKDIDSAQALAKLMTTIGTACGRKTAALITSMNQPLGQYIGSNAECYGAMRVLQGDKNDLATVACALAQKIAELAGISSAREKIERAIDNGAAYEKLIQIVNAHGGKETAFRLAPCKISVKAEREGYLVGVHTDTLGEANCLIGGGRRQLGDTIDHEVGLKVEKRLGDYVKQGDTLAVVFARTHVEGIETLVRSSFEIGNEQVILPQLIAATIG